MVDIDQLINKYISVELNKLFPAKWNYKKEDEKLSEKLVANLKKNGQIENLIIRERGNKFEVVNGNHRLFALLTLERTHAVCYNLGNITTAKAMEIALETNETRFPTDHLKLAAVMESITKQIPIEEFAKTVNFTPEEIERYKNLTKFDWSAYEQNYIELEPTGTGVKTYSIFVDTDAFDEIKRITKTAKREFDKKNSINAKIREIERISITKEQKKKINHALSYLISNDSEVTTKGEALEKLANDYLSN